MPAESSGADSRAGDEPFVPGATTPAPLRYDVAHWSVALCGMAQTTRSGGAVRPVRIALIDGRVMVDHPAFAGTSMTIARPRAFETSADDVDPHATFLASLLVGSRPPALGLCLDCTLVNVPVCDAAFRAGAVRPEEAAQRICSAIDCALDLGVDALLVTLEFSVRMLPPFTQVAGRIDRAATAGVRTIVPAGNRPLFAVSPVCGLAGAVPVVATDRWGRCRRDSPTSPVLGRRGLRAPGEDLPGAVPPDGYARKAGASGAAVFAAAAFGRLRGRFGACSADRIWEALLTGDGSGEGRRSVVPPLLDVAAAARRLERSAA